MQNLLNKKYVILLLFLVLLSGSVFVRMYQLDKFGFWSDELYHVIAAQGILENGHPAYPSGVEYRRALSFTFLVSQSFKLFGINETAARIPSVLFNVIFLILGFHIVKKWFNTNIALMFLTVMGFSQYELLLTRQCRMYTAFQLFYFLGVFFFWMGFEGENKLYDNPLYNNNKYRKSKINPLYLFLSGVMLLISYHFHQLTIIFCLVLTTYVISNFLIEINNQTFLHSIKSKYGLLIIALITFSLFFLLLKPGVYLNFYNQAISLPGWKKGEPVSSKIFLWILRSESPTFFFLFPISGLYLLKTDYKKGLYIVLSFIVPLILHSYILKWKEERFMIYFFPFYVLTIVVFIEQIVVFAWSAKNKISFNISILNLLVTFCTIIALITFLYPWLFNTRNIYKQKFWIDWKPTLVTLSQVINNKSKVITLMDDQSFIYYYLKKTPDYILVPNEYYEDDEIEYRYFNSKFIKNNNEFKKIIDNYDDIWFIARKDEFFNKKRYFRKKIMENINENFFKYKMERNKNILVYKKIKN